MSAVYAPGGHQKHSRDCVAEFLCDSRNKKTKGVHTERWGQHIYSALVQPIK